MMYMNFNFNELDNLKQKLDSFRPIPHEVMELIDKKFKIEWTYNSNAIEGNTLSKQETSFFIQHGLTSKGKTLKDYLETQNHAEAIEWLKNIIKQNRDITEGLIKDLHALLLRGIDYIWVGPQENRTKKNITPGKYKTKPNHVITVDGDIHKYCEPLLVPDEMEELIDFINNSSLHPVETAARAHYRLVAIHPFADGNGRLARLLMNLILMKEGFVPVVIKNEEREEYYRTLMKADKGDLIDFIEMIKTEEKRSLLIMIEICRENLYE